MQPSVDIDYRGALRSLSRLSAAMPKATARGLNDVAFAAMRFEKRQLPKRLDRPSGFTKSGIVVDRATPSQAVQEATVRVADQRAKYLGLAEFGGKLTKANAGAMRGTGSDAIVIPIAEVVKNQLGSAGRNAVRRALKLPRAFLAKMSNQRYGGVWQRDEGGARNQIEPLLLFSDEADFKEPPLHFRDDVGGFAGARVRDAVSKRLDRELSRAVRV